jgi:signal transduction histidine kinase
VNTRHGPPRSQPPAAAQQGEEAEQAQRKRVLVSLLKAMAVIALLPALSSLLDPRNDRVVTLLFYGIIYGGLLILGRMAWRGRAVGAAWALSIFFWLLIASVTLFFGGMQGNNAATFVVSILLVGSVVRGRAPFYMAAASSLWCACVAWLELHGHLPAQLGPYSPINAWGAVTVMILLASVLLSRSLESLRELHEQTVAIARERDEALRRSIQSQKMELVGNLASGIAHDFNNLLAVISGASSLLRDTAEGKPGSEGSELLDDLDAATSRAALMNRQLLSFGRAPVAEQVAIDVAEVVGSLAPMLPRLIGPTISVELDLEPGSVVRAARAGLEQILLNLAVNARDAMPSGGKLSIGVSRGPENVLLSVADTGVGMDAATQARIFEPFFTTKASGTGLGLATVREIVSRSGGGIGVTSAPAGGTAFEIRLPRVDAPVPSPEAARSPAPVPTGSLRRILLVEDDLLVRRGLTRFLEREGFEVVAVADGEEALAMVGVSTRFACVVSDLAMPRLDGGQLEARLAQTFPSLPVVLLSGNRAPPPTSGGPGRRAFLEKPFEHAALRRAIDELTR